MTLPANPADQEKAVKEALRKVISSPNLLPAVVLSTSPQIKRFSPPERPSRSTAPRTLSAPPT